MLSMIDFLKRSMHMAVKNHSLDDKIIKSAVEEFLERGFLEASLHKIAERAGVTTGALYTRYKNKDALFCSLLEDAFAAFRERSEQAAEKYAAVESGSSSDFLAAMEYEGQIYFDVFFEHYEACVLLFCKSGGSSAEQTLKSVIYHKVRSTVDFLKKTAKQPVNSDAVRLLMEADFHIYRQLLESGLEKPKAAACMKTVQDFLNSGWRELYERLHSA